MSGPRRRALACLIAIAAAAPLRALPQSAGISFVHITRDEGLSKNSTLAILQDRDGFMWFATENGLNRYDGNEFTVFRHVPGDANSLSHNYTLSFIQDREGIFWIGTFNGGLNRYDPRRGEFRCYRRVPGQGESLSSDTVGAICEDSAGALWIGTDKGLDRLDRGSGRFSHYPLAGARIGRDDQVFDIHEGRGGALWIATYGNGLYRLDRATGEFRRFRSDAAADPGPGHDFINCVHEDRQGRIWIGSDGGLIQLEPGSGRFIHNQDGPGQAPAFLNDPINAIYEDRSGSLWIGTNGGLAVLDPKSGNFAAYHRNSLDSKSLSSDWISSICEDRSGIVWIGTADRGINRCNPNRKKFLHYRSIAGQDNSLSADLVFAFCEDAARTLWIGTADGLDRFDRARGRFTHYRSLPGDGGSFRHTPVRCMLADRSGGLWLGTDGDGLKYFDPRSGRTVAYRNRLGDPTSLSHGRVRVLHEDRAGRLWLGTLGGGLGCLDRETGIFTNYRFDENDPDSLSGDIVRSILQDRTGALWIGTHGGGLNRFDRATGKFARYRNDPADPASLSSDFVFCLHEDRAGNIWAGTWGGGLNRLDREKGTFSRFTMADGLASNEIYAILEDPSGNLWLMTNEGLSRFTPGSRQSRNYDVSDGLQSREFLSGSFYQSPSGEMFFGGANGFNAFYPQDIFDNVYLPPVRITSFKIMNKEVRLPRPIWETREIELTPGDHLFSFEFAALDYAAPEKNRYAYKLEGLTDEWIRTDARHRQASFSRLPPGRYVLRVKGSNSDGFWNEEEARLAIRVRAPWWRSPWLLALLLGLTGVSGHQWRRTRLRRAAARIHTEVARDQLLEKCGISPRQREIVLLLLKGRSNKEIAAELFIELSTVKIHIHHVFRKLGVGTRTQLMRLFQNLRVP